MYTVVKMFHDLQDSEHEYNVGDTYPREGFEPSLSRIDELASDQNKQGVPLIVQNKETPEEPEKPAPAKPKRRKSKKDPE